MTRIIEAHQISKKYILTHSEQGAYSTLVETLANKAHSCLKKIRHPFTKIASRIKEEFWALQDIDLIVEEGDRIGIIGRNGAGKSTLLKILSRITEPTSGHIKIHGRVSSLLEVGTGFHPELTGRENIFLNGAILGMTNQEIKKKFDEIVAFAEVEKFLDTPVKRFSSGMHTRLGFAIAAHLDPDLFIIDEVLAVGDTQFQEKCLKKLRDLSHHGRTVLFVSHDIGSILTLCNKGLFLEKGRIKDSGPIAQCVNTYMNTCRLHALDWNGLEGDEHIRFYKASLTPPADSSREFFYQNEKTSLEVEYEILKSSPDMKLGIGIWNQRSQLLACSHTSDHADSSHLFTQKGRHRISFAIDAGLFHEGEYLIKLDCAIHNKKRILSDEIALKFAVYALHKNTRFHHAAQRDGIFLGHHWKRNEKVR